MAIENIYGNTQGLKSNQIKQLQKLYDQRISTDQLTTVDFSQRLGAISTEINQPVSAYINRRGQVIRVGVGTPHQTQIPALELPRYGEGRLSGIRCITCHLKSDTPGETEIVAMALQRLDALVVLTVTGQGFQRRGGGITGYIKDAYLLHLLPENNQELNQNTPSNLSSIYHHLSEPMSLDNLTNQDFLELIENLESEFQSQFAARKVDANQDKVLLVGVMTQDVTNTEFEDGLLELARLVDTAGGVVLDTLRQKRSKPHPQTVVGEGKIEEIALAMQTLSANLIVFDRDLSPSQARNLETKIGVRVLDRTEVILDIFAQRARSRAGKLQVELAQLQYNLPRLMGKGQAMSRLGGGIGTRGPGETKLETERREIARRISRLQHEVNELQAHRSRLRQQRQHQEVPSVAIVGYTNAGKSTLLNILTNSEVYAADQLFATLDPTTRRILLPDALTGEARSIVLTDTVGFIRKLPPALMDAFRATMEEVTDADAIIHLVDLSHPAWQSQIRSVLAILREMPITTGPSLLVFNKIDQVDGETLAVARDEFPLAVFISAGKGLGLETLRQKIAQLVYYTVNSL